MPARPPDSRAAISFAHPTTPRTARLPAHPATPRTASIPWRAATPHAAALLAVALPVAACRPDAAPPPARPPAPPATAPTSQPAPPPAKRDPARVTILYTSDEHGWLYGQGEGPKLRGGAAEALARWITDDAHCPLRAPDPTAGEPCKDPATLLLSGGDNFTGPAVSTYFRGLPMAQAMARMGYVASAFGNHDYDFERPAFDANRAASGVRYLAANIRAKDPAKDPGFPPFLLVERRRLRIGIVGLATEKTPQEAAPSRFEGLAFDPPGPALDRAITAAYTAGADTVVLLAHACEDEITPTLEAHPEWHLSFVGLGHCHRRVNKRIAGAPVLMPAWRLDAYARVDLDIDPSRPERDRVTSIEASLINIRPREDLSPDPAVASLRASARKDLDAVLGAVIGYSATGMDDDSEAMGRWLTRALREQTGADIALTNWTGIRDSLPRGPIHKHTLYSILPFDNTVYLMKVTGAALPRILGERTLVASGATRTDTGQKKPDGRAHIYEVHLDNGTLVDPKKTYTLALSDFLYDTSKAFNFKSADPTPRRTGQSMRAAILTWTEKQATTEKTPLEKKVGGSTAPPKRKPKPKPKPDTDTDSP
ncbi:MAG: bifunctional UDP-sugar hydrolase/5'-nucleotidase [Polyangiaceae bacterium]